MSQKRTQKKSELDKNLNYKNLIAQYYDRDSTLADVQEQIKTINPEIQILQQLTDFQKKIDSLIKTKRYDVQEIFMKPAKKVRRLLRIRVVREQGLVKVFGNLYPNDQKNQNSSKFTSFFRQIKCFLNSEKSAFQTWKKPVSNFQEKDGIIIKLSSQPESIVLNLYLINNPPKFQVEQNLQKIVGMRIGTRVQVLEAFWLYVKNRKLQDMENKQVINADQNIRNAFKTDKLTFATINSRIRDLLIGVQPIKIYLKSGQTRKVIDAIVDIQQKPNVDILPFFAQKLNQEKNDHPYLSLNSKIKKYQKKFIEHTQKLRRHLAKRQIYMNFKPEKIESIIREQYDLLKILKKGQPAQDFNKLEFILQNEDQVQKQIKHYFEQITIERSQSDSN